MNKEERAQMIGALMMEDIPCYRLYYLPDDELLKAYLSYYPEEKTEHE